MPISSRISRRAQSSGASPEQHLASRVAVLAHEPHPFLIVHRHQRHRADVIDNFQPGRLAVREADFIPAHVERTPMV
jgi:uridine kinase